MDLLYSSPLEPKPEALNLDPNPARIHTAMDLLYASPLVPLLFSFTYYFVMITITLTSTVVSIDKYCYGSSVVILDTYCYY